MQNNSGVTNTPNLIIAVSLILTVTLGCSMIQNLRSDKTSNSSPTPVAATPAANTAPTPEVTTTGSKAAGDMKSSASELTKIPAKTQLAKSAYIKGKFVLFHKLVRFGETGGEWEVKEPSSNLSKVAAATPVDVGTVVLLSCTELKKGDFVVNPRSGDTKTIPGYNRKCELTLIDRTIDAVVFRKSFESVLNNYEEFKDGDPDAKRIVAPIPFNQVFQFLESLPQSAVSIDKTLSVKDLLTEFNASPETVGKKYFDKEITVRGFAGSAPQEPKEEIGGLLMLGDKEDVALYVSCWFAPADAAEFSKVKGMQFVTVKGISKRYQQIELQSCKVVKIE